MIKTKRGVRTLAFTLAFAMIACLVPTIALANTIELLADPSYDASTGTITVTGKITTPGADVTILALGATTGSATLSDLISGKTDAQIADSISYIDQVTSDGADATVPGKFEFTFKRRTGSASGAFLNISVGGADVAAPVTRSIEAAPNGPELSIVGDKAYYGDPIELTFTDSEEWRTAIASIANGRIPSIKIDNTEVYSQATIEAGKITLPSIEKDKTSITVTVTADGFKNSVVTVAVSAKTAGTIEPQDDAIIASDADVKFDLANAVGFADWISDIQTIKINETEINDFSITDDVMSVPVSNFVLSNTEESKQFTVAIAVDYYNEVSASVTVKAPTFAVAAPSPAPTVVYGVASDPADDAEGDAKVTIPADPTELYGSTVKWELKLGDGAFEVKTERGAENAITLERPEKVDGQPASAPNVYTLKRTVSKGDFKAAEKIYKLEVSPLGVAGVNVDITLDSSKIPAAALALATVTVDDVAATGEGNKFTAKTLVAGTHTAVIARPGFVTLTIEFVTDTNGVVSADAAKITNVAMIAGDVDNNGVVDVDDFLSLNDIFNKESTDPEFKQSCNFDGNGVIDVDDFLMLNDNFNYGA